MFGQNVDHAYYISKIYGPGDRAGRELWVDVDEMGEEWKVRGFLSSAHRQAEVPVQQRITSGSSRTLCCHNKIYYYYYYLLIVLLLVVLLLLIKTTVTHETLLNLGHHPITNFMVYILYGIYTYRCMYFTMPKVFFLLCWQRI